MREKAFARWLLRMSERLAIGAKQLPPLPCGDMVVVQDHKVEFWRPCGGSGAREWIIGGQMKANEANPDKKK